MMVSSTDTSWTKDGCPPLEDLAAFLDGRLSGEERARMTAHVADCEHCYDVFTGAARFQEDSAARGRVFQFPFRKRKPGEPRKPTAQMWSWSGTVMPSKAVGMAASVLLVVGLVSFIIYRAFLAQAEMTVADLIEPLQGQEAANHLYEYTRYRGEDDDVLSWGAPSFMVGVYLVDLRLSLAAGDVKTSEELLREIGNELNNIDFMDDEAKRYLTEATQLVQTPSVDMLRKIAATAPEREKSLGDEDASFLDLPSLAFGKWTEAARLAAVTRTPDFFEKWSSRRFLNRVIEDKETAKEKRDASKPQDQDPSEDSLSSELDPEWEMEQDREDEVLNLLYQVRNLWKDDDLTEEDYAALAGMLDQIIDQYDRSST